MAWALTDVREGLAAVMTAARSDVNIYETMPASPNVPAAMVSPVPELAAAFDTFERGATLHLMVLFVVRKVDEAGAQAELDGEIATDDQTSMLYVLDTAQHAAWESCSVREVRGYGAFTFGAGENPPVYLGCQFVLDVMVA